MKRSKLFGRERLAQFRLLCATRIIPVRRIKGMAPVIGTRTTVLWA
jgi:hypothetical protein